MRREPELPLYENTINTAVGCLGSEEDIEGWCVSEVQ